MEAIDIPISGKSFFCSQDYFNILASRKILEITSKVMLHSHPIQHMKTDSVRGAVTFSVTAACAAIQASP